MNSPASDTNGPQGQLLEPLELSDAGEPRKYTALVTDKAIANSQLGPCVELSTREWGEDFGREIWLDPAEARRLHEWLGRWLEAHP